MSLLDSFKDTYIIMERTRVPDGEGGFTTQWSDGATIDLAIRHDSTIEARKAEAEGVTSTYTFLAPINCGLEFHDVLKRVSDGVIFRITSNSGDEYTPNSSSLKLTSFTAERWMLT